MPVRRTILSDMSTVEIKFMIMNPKKKLNKFYAGNNKWTRYLGNAKQYMQPDWAIENCSEDMNESLNGYIIFAICYRNNKISPIDYALVFKDNKLKTVDNFTLDNVNMLHERKEFNF